MHTAKWYSGYHVIFLRFTGKYLCIQVIYTFFAETHTIMRKQPLLLLISFLIALTAAAQADALKLDDNEFLAGKKMVAEVKDVKLGFMKRQVQLLNDKKEVLLALPTSTITLSTNPLTYLNLLSIIRPSTLDTIQINFDNLRAEGIDFGISPGTDHLAALLFKNNMVNADGSLNNESFNALKSRYPLTALQDYENKMAAAARCNKSVNTPTDRDKKIAATITEISRDTANKTATIKYKAEHNGVLLGEIIVFGPVENLANERAEVEYKTKVFASKKEGDYKPMTYLINNTTGCQVAIYKPWEKRLYTSRADKGGYHGIMKPILNEKAETVQSRKEIVGAMVDYLIGLGYY